MRADVTGQQMSVNAYRLLGRLDTTVRRPRTFGVPPALLVAFDYQSAARLEYEVRQPAKAKFLGCLGSQSWIGGRLVALICGFIAGDE
jgi:hypothetical protein